MFEFIQTIRKRRDMPVELRHEYDIPRERYVTRSHHRPEPVRFEPPEANEPGWAKWLLAGFLVALLVIGCCL